MKKTAKVKSTIFFLTCTIAFLAPPFYLSSYAQQDDTFVALTKTVMEVKTPQEAYRPLQEIIERYVKENKFSEGIKFLKSLSLKKTSLEPLVNYFIAFCRFKQLSFLEETQLWDEYFSHGGSYREELTSSLEKTIALTTSDDAVNLYARLLLWRFHRHQEDTFQEASLSDLVSATVAFSQKNDGLETLKYIADQLFLDGEKTKSKELYKMYVSKIVETPLKDEELSAIATGFFKDGNLDLSEGVYDAYIERVLKLTPKEPALKKLIEIAQLFAYKPFGASDTFYAEKIFKKIEEIGGQEAFDETLLYLRAFNLEKGREFPQARDFYLDFVKRFPQSAHANEADFKSGIIAAYVLNDADNAKAYFQKLAQKETVNPYVISSLYQLGLLEQWKENTGGAKEYYDTLLERAKLDFTETVTLTKERLQEIGGQKPIEYRLKTFLDVSLKPQAASSEVSALEIKAQPYKAKKDEPVHINTSVFMGESGCMSVQVQYLWSGHLGDAQPAHDAASFDTRYIHPGTKEINLVVVSPSGVVDHTIDMVDIE